MAQDWAIGGQQNIHLGTGDTIGAGMDESGLSSWTRPVRRLSCASAAHRLHMRRCIDDLRMLCVMELGLRVNQLLAICAINQGIQNNMPISHHPDRLLIHKHKILILKFSCVSKSLVAAIIVIVSGVFITCPKSLNYT